VTPDDCSVNLPFRYSRPQPSTRSQLALSWGVETFIVPPARHTDAMVRQVEEALLHIGRCDKGDKVVIVAGSPRVPRAAPTRCGYRIGDAAARGAGLG
jgi:pyruvate kinase